MGCMFFLILISSADAAIYNCSNCSNCESAISDASAGDTVNLLADIANQSWNCIVWDNSNVTFDCQQHGIDGTDTLYGIVMEYDKGNVIKNCVITDFMMGIYLYYSDNNQIGDNTIESNTGNGIKLSHSAGNLISGNTLKSNTEDGLYVFGSGSQDNTILNNLASSNNYNGIYIRDSSSNTLTNNTANSNDDHGIRLRESFNNTLTSNTANSNTMDGISLYDSSNNTITGNTANSNSYYGIYIVYPSGSTVNSNEACYNDVDDIHLYNSEDNSGDENTCDTTYEWNDEGATGCTNACGAATSTSSTSTSTSTSTTPSTINVTTSTSTSTSTISTTSTTSTSTSTSTTTLPLGETTCSNCSDCSNKLNGSYSTVRLDADITEHSHNCIEFNTNGTVFDCQGHIIDGNYTSLSGSGVYISDKSSNTVKNCIITDFNRGIYVYYSPSNTLINNSVSSNMYGVHLHMSNYSTIDSNTVESNLDFGILLSFSSYSYMANNRFCSHGVLDIFLEYVTGNSGDENTCDSPGGWNDTGTTYCTYGCSAVTTTTTSTTSTTTIQPQVMLARILPDEALPGENLTVTLSLDVNESNTPNSIGITETPPAGWEILETSIDGNLQSAPGSIEWLLWDMGTSVEDMNITYTLHVPENANGTYYFSGEFMYYLGDTRTDDNIFGDELIIVNGTSVLRPHLTVSRGNTTINENYIDLEFIVENDGNSTAENISVWTWLAGFIPARETTYNYNSSNFSLESYGSAVKLVLNSLGSQTSTSMRFTAVPVLAEDDVDYEIDSTGHVDVTYIDSDGVEYSETFTTSASIQEQDVYSAISASDYLIVTNPSRLYSYYSNADVHSLLLVMSKLAREENGVLGFVTNYSAESLERLIDNGWNGRMNSQWRDDGFLLLVGETEIIPSWDISFDCEGSLPLSLTATSSDNVYADILEGDSYAPELYIGRIIGNSASDLENSITNSIDASLQRDNALIASGSGNGWESFLNNAIEAVDILSDWFSTTRLYMGNYSTDGEKFNEFSSYTSDADLIFWRDHGSEQSWGTGFIDTDNAASLDLSSLPLVFSSACLTGHYQNTYSLAEAFLANGAGVFIGSTEVSYRTFNNEFSKTFFNEFMHSTERPVGKSLREAKREFRSAGTGSCQMKALLGYTINEYNLYGNPKLGSSSIQQSELIGIQTVEGPLSSLNVTVPDYTVTEMFSEHWVEIPSGNMLLEPGNWQIPYYRTAISYPAGYKVQGVSILERDGLMQATGLIIPEVSMETGGIPTDKSHGVLPQNPGFYPSSDFSWETVEYLNGTTILVISMYPFYYDANTTEVQFYKNYSFGISYSLSFVTMGRVQTDKENYLIGEQVSISFDANNTQIPINATVNATIRYYGNNEIADSIGPQTISVDAGVTEGQIYWNSTGFEAGYYLVSVKLSDPNGYELDSATERFRLGLVSGEMADFSASPQRIRIGEYANISLIFDNIGTENISGSAAIKIYNSSSSLVGEFNHSFTNLNPLDAVDFSFIFTPSAVDTYKIIGFILYGSESTEPQEINMTVGCAMRGDAQPCDSIIEDLEFLLYLDLWGQDEVENSQVLESVENWIDYGSCEIEGDTPPCGAVELAEVIDFITEWDAGSADLEDVIDLINEWVPE